MTRPEDALPPDILQRAFAGNELAWRISDIPAVISAARDANLINVGGQLQFRPDRGTCECYRVEVDTYNSVDKSLPWKERVRRTAEVGLNDFEALPHRFDFIAEGRSGFGRHLAGRDPAEFMCFVWYVLSEADEKALNA